MFKQRLLFYMLHIKQKKKKKKWVKRYYIKKMINPPKMIKIQQIVEYFMIIKWSQ